MLSSESSLPNIISPTSPNSTLIYNIPEEVRDQGNWPFQAAEDVMPTHEPPRISRKKKTRRGVNRAARQQESDLTKIKEQAGTIGVRFGNTDTDGPAEEEYSGIRAGMQQTSFDGGLVSTVTQYLKAGVGGEPNNSNSPKNSVEYHEQEYRAQRLRPGHEWNREGSEEESTGGASTGRSPHWLAVLREQHQQHQRQGRQELPQAPPRARDALVFNSDWYDNFDSDEDC
jgi:hypothetical protein